MSKIFAEWLKDSFKQAEIEIAKNKNSKRNNRFSDLCCAFKKGWYDTVINGDDLIKWEDPEYDRVAVPQRTYYDSSG